MKHIRIGTRPSKLALAQTELVIHSLKEYFPDLTTEVVVIKTSGDAKQNVTADVIRDKRDWIEEIELAVLEDRIDLAVHSGKDVPYDISQDTELHSVLERADPRDIFIGKPAQANNHGVDKKRISLEAVSAGDIIGTSSLRRRAQLLQLNSKLGVAEIRGNVPTRILKLDSEARFSGIVLAAAGLQRLAISSEFMELIAVEKMLPASAQGILTVQYKKTRTDIGTAVSKLIHQETEAALIAERAAILTLGADCHSAVAVHANVIKNKLKVTGRVFACTGPQFIEAQLQGNLSMADELGTSLGNELLQKGARQLLTGS